MIFAVALSSKQINQTFLKGLSTITLTALCSSELFLSFMLISREAMYMEITCNVKFLDQGFKRLRVLSHLENLT